MADSGVEYKKDTAHFLESHRSDLIQQISSIYPVLDKLLDSGILTSEQYNHVKNQGTSQGKMRELLDLQRHWNSSTKDTIYNCLKTENPHFPDWAPGIKNSALKIELSSRQPSNDLETTNISPQNEEEKERVTYENVTLGKICSPTRGHTTEPANAVERMYVFFEDIWRQLDVLECRILTEISNKEEQVWPSFFKQIRQGRLQNYKLSQNMNRPGSDNDLDEGLISATVYTGFSDIITGINKGIYVPAMPNLLLDVNTAENHVHISGDLKQASWSQVELARPKREERFHCSQVLSSQGYSTGKLYWSVAVSKAGAWRLGMCYPTTRRGGNKASIGSNTKSWSLCRWLDNAEFAVFHNGKTSFLPAGISSRKFGVYLDYEAGRLSFYELCNPIRHLHTFFNNFTEPLHAAIYVWDQDSGKECTVRLIRYEE